MLGLSTYFLIALALLVATWRTPAACLAALLCVQVLDFWGQLSSPLIYRYGLATNIFMVGLVMLGVIKAQLSQGAGRRGFTAGSLWAAIFWIYSASSLTWSLAPAAGIQEWQRYVPYMVLTLVVPLSLRNRPDLEKGLRVLAYVGAGLVILVDLFVTWQDRYVVSFWDPSQRYWNALAFSELAGFVALVVMLLEFPRTALMTTFRIATVIACLVLAVKSGTRGQFALMVLVPVVLLPARIHVKNPASFFSMALVAALFVGAAIWTFQHFGPESDLDGRWSGARLDSDWSMRMDMVRRLLEVWWQRATVDPTILLLGLGNSSAFDEHIIGFYPHCLAAEVLAEEGIAGLFLFTVLLLRFVSTARATLRLTQLGSSERSAAVTLIGLFLFAFVLSFKQGSLAGFTAELFLFVLLLESQKRVLEFSRSPDSASVDAAQRVGHVRVMPRFENLMT